MPEESKDFSKEDESKFLELKSILDKAKKDYNDIILQCWEKATELKKLYPDEYLQCRLYHLLAFSGELPQEPAQVLDFPGGECEEFIRSLAK